MRIPHDSSALRADSVLVRPTFSFSAPVGPEAALAGGRSPAYTLSDISTHVRPGSSIDTAMREGTEELKFLPPFTVRGMATVVRGKARPLLPREATRAAWLHLGGRWFPWRLDFCASLRNVLGRNIAMSRLARNIALLTPEDREHQLVGDGALFVSSSRERSVLSKLQ